LHMSVLIYTQLGVSPDTQIQTGFAGFPSSKELNFSHITSYKDTIISEGVDCSTTSPEN